MPVENRTRLVSDDGSSYLSHAFEDYLRMVAIRQVGCARHHPQTNGTIERVRQPGAVVGRPGNFIEFYNHGRYHREMGT